MRIKTKNQSASATAALLLAAGVAALPLAAWSEDLLLPASASSGDTKSLTVDLEIKSGNFTLPGPSPTATPPKKDKLPPQNPKDPVVKARAVSLLKSTPAAIPSTASTPLLVGPTIRIRPGDTLGINLKNGMKYDVFSGDSNHSMTIPHGFDVINIHTHGLHVSPQSPSDNVLLSIFPQDTPTDVVNACAAEMTAANCVMGQFAYSYNIPANHPAGTYWYHSHKHGAVAMHLADGFAGALIVEDPLHGIDSLPEVQAAREQVVVLQQIAYGGAYKAQDGKYIGSGTAADPYLIDCQSVYGFTGNNGCDFNHSNPPPPKIGNTDSAVKFYQGEGGIQLSVNGQFQPTITMKTKEVQLWRVVNAAIDKVVPMCLMPLAGTDSSKASFPESYVLAVDGVPLQKPNVTGDARPVQLKIPAHRPATGDDLLNNELLFLAPGQRLDLMVKAPEKAGTYALYEAGNNTRINSLCNVDSKVYIGKKPILTVRVDEPQGITPYNTSLPHQTALNQLTAPKPISEAETPALPTQGVVYGFTSNTYAQQEGGASVINARVFNPLRSQRDLVLNQTERWSVQSAMDTHMFHIHINPFQLLARGQLQYPFPIWRDTMLINCASNLITSVCTYLGSLTDDQFSSSGTGDQVGEIVQFAQKPLDFTGLLVQHCHNVSHEDQGMMELVQIKPPLQADAAPQGHGHK